MDRAAVGAGRVVVRSRAAVADRQAGGGGVREAAGRPRRADRLFV